MNDYVKEIINKRKEHLQSLKESSTKEVEYAKEHLAKTEKELSDIDKQLALLEEDNSDAQEKKEALLRGAAGTVRFECTSDQFMQMQVQLNSDDEFIYFPGGSVRRKHVNIIKWA